MPKFTVRLASWPIGQQKTVNAQTIVEAAEHLADHTGEPKAHRYFDHYVVVFPGYLRQDGKRVNGSTVFVKRVDKEKAT